MPAVVAGALYGALAVAIGAFGAHVLDGRGAVVKPELFETAVLYQGFNAAALVAVGALIDRRAQRVLRAAAWALAVGIPLFCGSLYAMALGAPGALAVLAPLGGGALIAGWLLLAIGAARASPVQRPGPRRRRGEGQRAHRPPLDRPHRRAEPPSGGGGGAAGED